ncbi:cyanophycinase [Pedobacter changchengzhani]|uniref:Cyanophycinase n=1 Tax=Pedobacter changchengzhani TaxID=2529274 RepID=A0A4R5MM31_9SPHI|nr:cyanophycinase [Pedobacter changchengzhani]TDG36712.1 cyanophycinase [Pedobacter changchengzhani]
MRNIIFGLLIGFWISALGCSKSTNPIPTPPSSGVTTPPTSQTAKRRPASIGIVGDTANVIKTVNGGMVLMGGGAEVDAALQWMIAKSGGGDIVILRATGDAKLSEYVNTLGIVNSCETLLINSRELANNDTVANIIRNAEMVFIAGGDQSDYMKYWKGTKTEVALNYVLNTKKAPVGGTSAGCAIMGGFYYSGENGSVTSQDALKNPFDSRITLYNNDFLKAPFLQSVITDQHYLTRARRGRSMVFLGRILTEFNVAAKGIAVDERTAVCIDGAGIAKVYGDLSKNATFSTAYFLSTDLNKKPEQFSAGNKVIWSNNKSAVAVYSIISSVEGAGSFNVSNFAMSEATGGTSETWYIENGVLSPEEIYKP